MDKFLLMLPGMDARAVADTLESAVKNAFDPGRLHPVTEVEVPAQTRLKCSRGEGQRLFNLWQGEKYALTVPAGTVFERCWDLRLWAAFKRLKTEKALLTGMLPRPGEPFGPMPVAAEGFDEKGSLCFRPGTPLCHCRLPQRCAFIHPEFIFAPAAFFKARKEWEEPLFLSAFQNDWEAYTLPENVMRHPAMPLPAPFEVTLTPPWREKDPMGRFEKKFGLEMMSRRLSSAARLGLYTPDLQYDMQPSPGLRAREALRRLTLRRQEASPLFITAFREMACPVRHMNGEYESWFRNLARLRELPLLLYAKGGPAKRVRNHFSNIYDLQQRYGLPLERLWKPEEDLWQFKAGKPFLISRAMAGQPHHTHYGWIDFGYQRWPLYARTAFDWRPLCDDVIHLARVEGKPDPSLFVVPRDLIPFLCDEMLHEAVEALKKGSLPPEEELWENILRRNPREFMLHDLDRKRGLLSLCHLP